MNPHLQQILHDITVRITKLEESQQPQRTWVGLTEDEITALESATDTLEFPQTVRAIEAKLKDKNL